MAKQIRNYVKKSPTLSCSVGGSNALISFQIFFLSQSEDGRNASLCFSALRFRIFLTFPLPTVHITKGSMILQS